MSVCVCKTQASQTPQTGKKKPELLSGQFEISLFFCFLVTCLAEARMHNASSRDGYQARMYISQETGLVNSHLDSSSGDIF